MNAANWTLADRYGTYETEVNGIYVRLFTDRTRDLYPHCSFSDFYDRHECLHVTHKPKVSTSLADAMREALEWAHEAAAMVFPPQNTHANKEAP